MLELESFFARIIFSSDQNLLPPLKSIVKLNVLPISMENILALTKFYCTSFSTYKFSGNFKKITKALKLVLKLRTVYAKINTCKIVENKNKERKIYKTQTTNDYTIAIWLKNDQILPNMFYQCFKKKLKFPVMVPISVSPFFWELNLL